MGYMRPTVAQYRVLILYVNIGLKEEDNKQFIVYGFYKVSSLKLGYYTIIKRKTSYPCIFPSTKAARYTLVLYINSFID